MNSSMESVTPPSTWIPAILKLSLDENGKVSDTTEVSTALVNLAQKADHWASTRLYDNEIGTYQAWYSFCVSGVWIDNGL